MSSNAEVIKFPKKAKSKPQPPQAQKKPWWVVEAQYILTQARQHPEVNRLISDNTRAFVHVAARWPNPPNEKQKAWLMGTGDMVEAKVESIREWEAFEDFKLDHTPPTKPPAA